MINLLKAEATRWLNRRMLWVFAVVTLLAFAGLATIVFFFSKPPSPAQEREAEVVYQQALKDWQESHEEFEADCKAEIGDDADPDQCTYPEPTRADFSVSQPVQALAPILLLGGGAILALAVFIVSASYIGAEMSSGAIANWLTFNPSRWKVMLSKLSVALLGSALFAAVFMGLGLGTVAIIDSINGSATDAVKWTPVLQQGGRIVALVVIVAAIGFAIALIARHTAAALGAIGVFFVAQIITGIFGQSEKFAPVIPWLPENNALAFVLHDYPYSVAVNKVTADGVQQDFAQRILTFEHGLVYLLVCFVTAVVVSFVVFQRRDVN